jgi:hypothetical protein
MNTQIVLFLVVLVGFAGVALFLIFTGILGKVGLNRKNKHTDAVSSGEKTAQDMVNVRDVKDRYLYTKDNLVMMYVRISPISVDLLSEREKRGITRTLTAELSGERNPMKFLAVSRPVDISPLVSEYSQLMFTASYKQKELLRNEMMVMSNYALSGEVVERQFYLIIWAPMEEQCERELAKRAQDLIIKFEGSGVKCETLKSQDIVRLCNLINNPAYSHIEDSDFAATIPILNNFMEEAK